VLHLDFHFPQFVVNCLGGWICAVGIPFYILWYYVVVSRGIFIFSLVIVNNLFQEVFEDVVL
jgi:hypothetical protein